MPIVEELKKAVASFPAGTPDPEELARLESFFRAMKAAGVARTREYDLPPLDTIGRSVLQTMRRPSQNRVKLTADG
jgi:hypothetical protein